MEKKRPVIVSACLVGLRTRYDATDSFDLGVIEAADGATLVPVCPEQLGGLSTPRPRAEIDGGAGEDVLEGRARVKDESGRDATDAFIQGARETLKAARLVGAVDAFLKEKSPSCGATLVCRGGEPVRGRGVTAALLEKSGIKVRGF